MTQSHQLIGPWDGTHPGFKTSPYYHGWYQHVMAAADRKRAAEPVEYYDGRDGSLEQTEADREFTKGTPYEDA